MSKKVLIVMLLAASAAGGCQEAGFLLYLFQPPRQTKTVAPEFAELPNRAVAVVVFADQAVQYEYPYARLTLSRNIAAELKKRVKGAGVAKPQHIVKFQDDNIRWDSLDKTALGKRFGADYVLYVVLLEYTMRERGSLNLFRGRITAQVSLYQTSLPERRSCVWRGSNISVLHPSKSPLGEQGRDDSAVRYQTERIFADKLVKNFYKHKVPKSQ